ncbi:MAG: di-trans,poly-cis-decaprenylcistransferase [Nevskiaceae bacterium]|nr:MAG: di-trans,poly-cis-decaprenylcistransferase [Nevskiaceae bacterium]TBR71784.1 MAG: di-trans,poly-cis-decaprenylcistransferase [Nevskiaceae bacterium]
MPPPDHRLAVPAHVAIIMDGNGRWAQQRHRPRGFGHAAGVRRAHEVVEASHVHGVHTLTLFAFSQENWQRPAQEVGLLMQLFAHTIAVEVKALHRNGVRVRFIGDRAAFAPALRAQMEAAERLTDANTGLNLHIAAGYGGHWDIVQAARHAQQDGVEISEASLAARLSTQPAAAPDLLIRTGGEQRISNFMLWQMAYTELYFTAALWPDFGVPELDAALAWYAGRQRRFGRVPDPR